MGLALILALSAQISFACTGIVLKTVNDDYFVSRTMEWGTFILDANIVVMPRGGHFTGETEKGATGMEWSAKYGFVGISLNKEFNYYLGEGLNEKGLCVCAFYFPGYASYKPYSKNDEKYMVSQLQLPSYLLQRAASIEDVKEIMRDIVVTPVYMDLIGIVPPLHWRVTDRDGHVLIIEIVNNGEVKLYDSEIGVITNAPGYDWHMTNLRNYVNLQPDPQPTMKLSNTLNLAPLGAGSGFLGIPGDFTPPSRFVRAAAYSMSVPPLQDAYAAMTQSFTILDNFNIPIGSIHKVKKETNLRSSTQWTSVCDLSNLVMYYHTYWNRTIRKISLKDINFKNVKMQVIPMDEVAKQDIKEVRISR